MGRTGGIGRMGAAVAVAALICQVGCNRPASPPTSTMPAHQDFEKLTDDFTRSVLAFSPVSATQAGYHEHNGMSLDEALDDFSPAGLDAQRRFYQDTQKRLAAAERGVARQGQQADLEILRNNVGVRAARARHDPELPTQPDGVRRAGGQRAVHAVRAELRAARRAASATSSSASRRFPRCSIRPRRTSSTRRRSGTAWRARRTTATST